MSIGSVIVLSGALYACTCIHTDGITQAGIIRGRISALFYLAVGITVEILLNA